MVKGVARLLVPSGGAKPSPAIGQALGPLGVNMAEFCKKFNDETSSLVPDMPLPVTLTAYEDRTYDFVTRTPSASFYLKKAAGLEKGSKTPGKDVVGDVSVRAIYEIAKIKKTDKHLQALSEEALTKSIVSTAKSMGLRVVE